jgi:UDP-N-acetylglucosamine 2-epimerase (non-hydrolysing)
MTETRAAILVLIGTKAQFIKTAPVLLELDRRGIAYRLVYTGQHSETFDVLEKAFGTRVADENLVPGVEAATHSSFAGWSAAFWGRGLRRIRSHAWRDAVIAVVHGDTASTLFGALLARLGGLRVAHIEAGLRSARLFDPFPEELIRRLVSRTASLHLAPDAVSAQHLSGRAGVVVDTGGNTLQDALAAALCSCDDVRQGGGGGYAIASIHRTENLSDAARFDFLIERIVEAGETLPIRFVLHPATRHRLAKSGWAARLQGNPRVQLVDRMDYPAFVRLMLGSAFLMTDGGSNQEEAAMMGLPTLLLRMTTERADGLGDNVVLSELDAKVIREFVVLHAQAGWHVRTLRGNSPSAVVADELVAAVARAKSAQ